MTAHEIVLEIPAKPEYLQMVRAVVAAAASVEADLDAERVADLRLAVSEATTNAIEAHAQMGSSERITIREACHAPGHGATHVHLCNADDRYTSSQRVES